MAATLVYIAGVSTGATSFFNTLDMLLTNPFSSTIPRGLGWTVFHTYSATDRLYFSLGSGGSERIYLRLTVSNDNTYVDRSICTVANGFGTLLNSMGGTSQTRIIVGSSQFEWWVVANQDFIHIVTLVGSTYSHYYSGIINRFSPNQNSSIYGQTPPIPANTSTPYANPFTIGIGTTLFLRTGLDAYGGYGSNNLSFIPGQKLYVVDQSIGTLTSGHQGVVLLNGADIGSNTINVSYISGDVLYSSFAIIGVDPQPVALSTGGVIRGAPFLMLDDFAGESLPQFNAVNEFSPGSGLPPENIQNPNSRNIFITYPIRIFNSQEIRGTLYGLIDTPIGIAGAQDIFTTYDMLYRFINFPDGSLSIGMGSII
jgi:hypothetical protein